jgi:hypothetical protein
MKIMTSQTIEVVSDVVCDVCGNSTTKEKGYAPEFATLQADWGYGSDHDGEQYKVHLCETCFFSTLATLKEQRRLLLMFSEEDNDQAAFGRQSENNC